MMVTIRQLPGQEAYDLIYREHLSMLSGTEKDSMHRAMRNSDPLWLGCDGEEVFCAWGLIPPTLLSDSAYFWFYTTKHFSGREFIVARHSRSVVAECLRRYPILVGHCFAANLRGQRWIRWLGGEFGPAIEGGILPFEIRAKSWPQQLAQSA